MHIPFLFGQKLVKWVMYRIVLIISGIHTLFELQSNPLNPEIKLYLCSENSLLRSPLWLGQNYLNDEVVIFARQNSYILLLQKKSGTSLVTPVVRWLHYWGDHKGRFTCSIMMRLVLGPPPRFDMKSTPKSSPTPSRGRSPSLGQKARRSPKDKGFNSKWSMLMTKYSAHDIYIYIYVKCVTDVIN